MVNGEKLQFEGTPDIRNVALMCPGQGISWRAINGLYVQLSNTNPELVKTYLSTAQQTLDELNPDLNCSLLEQLHEPKSDLAISTEALQPIIYTLTVLDYVIQHSEEGSKPPAMVVGHSLGEYAALTIAGVFSFEVGIRLVTLRGKYMQQACNGTANLFSIDGLNEKTVEAICSKTGANIALVNSKKKIVVGIAVDKYPDLSQEVETNGGKASELKTAGPFHTLYMEEAASQLEKEFAIYDFNDSNVRYISNLTGEEVKDATTIKINLIRSMTHPVQWRKIYEAVKKLGLIPVEVGPGRSLTSLNDVNKREDIV